MGRMLRTYLALGLLAAGCSSTHATGGTGGGATTGGATCAAFRGSYSMTFAERSGNCGAIPEQIVQFPAAGMAANCSGSATVSSDGCSSDLDVTCSDTPNNISVRQVGHYDYGADGLSGTGTIQATVHDLQGQFVCSSTYSVSIRKL